MIYGFRCDCGQASVAEFSMNDPEKKLHCPKCGAWMWRDFSGVSIGGDLPSRWAKYDPGLGVWINDKADREREMARQGLYEYTPDPEMKSYRDEIGYIKRQTAKERGTVRQEAHKKIKELGKEAGRRRRKKIIDRALGSPE